MMKCLSAFKCYLQFIEEMYPKDSQHTQHIFLLFMYLLSIFEMIITSSFSTIIFSEREKIYVCVSNRDF